MTANFNWDPVHIPSILDSQKISNWPYILLDLEWWESIKDKVARDQSLLLKARLIIYRKIESRNQVKLKKN